MPADLATPLAETELQADLVSDQTPDLALNLTPDRTSDLASELGLNPRPLSSPDPLPVVGAESQSEAIALEATTPESTTLEAIAPGEIRDGTVAIDSTNVPRIAQSQPSFQPILTPSRITGGITEGRTALSLLDVPPENAATSQVKFELRHLGQSDSVTVPVTDPGSNLVTVPVTSQTWVIIHGWNSSPNELFATADAIHRARGRADTILMLDWSEAAQNGGNTLTALRNGGNYNAATWIASVADWAVATLRQSGLTDTLAATQLNLVGHSLGAYVSGAIADRFDQGVNTIFALDPASELSSKGVGYDFDNDGTTERPVRFDEVSRLSRAFVGSSSIAGNQTVASWAHESYALDFGFGFRDPGSEHLWVYEAFANFVDDEDAIAQKIGVKNLAPVSGWDKNAYSRRHEGRLVVDDQSREVERLVVKSAEVGQDEILYGTMRGERLSGGSGRDRLLGGAGDDQLWGGSDDDILVGGPGADQLWGGSGRDRFDFSAGDGGTTLADAAVIYDFFTDGSSRNTETLGLGTGLSLENLVLEAGMGEYAGDAIVRHGNEFLARLVGVGIGELAIAQNFVQLP